VRIHADSAFGAESKDVMLESAMPAGGTELPSEGLTAPLVFVGTARPAELQNIDVRGKIAVQHASRRTLSTKWPPPLGRSSIPENRDAVKSPRASCLHGFGSS